MNLGSLSPSIASSSCSKGVGYPKKESPEAYCRRLEEKVTALMNQLNDYRIQIARLEEENRALSSRNWDLETELNSRTVSIVGTPTESTTTGLSSTSNSATNSPYNFSRRIGHQRSKTNGGAMSTTSSISSSQTSSPNLSPTTHDIGSSSPDSLKLPRVGPPRLPSGFVDSTPRRDNIEKFREKARKAERLKNWSQVIRFCESILEETGLGDLEMVNMLKNARNKQSPPLQAINNPT